MPREELWEFKVRLGEACGHEEVAKVLRELFDHTGEVEECSNATSFNDFDKNLNICVMDRE